MFSASVFSQYTNMTDILLAAILAVIIKVAVDHRND